MEILRLDFPAFRSDEPDRIPKQIFSHEFYQKLLRSKPSIVQIYCSMRDERMSKDIEMQSRNIE